MSPPAAGLAMEGGINGPQSQEQSQAEDQADQEVAADQQEAQQEQPEEIPMNRHIIIIRKPKVKKKK